eukprot:TRINITY_DN3073_c0_g1_i2.p1 TRINITY_DN3073_c0_g1~~TRINITY_DN3073_c0_g1_i2.p1  ORF type:complete len:223 (+),score=37.79 TRINITY_DN3073_c0_g1_i2:92-670(+)
MDKLADEIFTGLQLLDKFDASQVTTLVEQSLKVISKEASEDTVFASPALQKVDAIQLKQVYSSLVGLLLHAYKLNADVMELESTLEFIDKEKVKLLTKRYTEYAPKIRNILSTTTFNFPHIVDTKWRLDYLVKSDTLERVNAPIYFIKLKTITNEGKVNFVEFTCTMEQLEDLLVKIEDAEASLERVREKLL